MALRGETSRLSSLRSWVANLLRAAASRVEESGPAKAGRTDDRDNSGVNDPRGATIARLREQYPGAPEHWIRILAEQTSVGNSRFETAHAPSPARGRQRCDEHERKRAVFPSLDAAKKAAAPPASFPSLGVPTRRAQSANFRSEATWRPAGGAAYVAFPETVRRRYPPLSFPAVRIRWMKEPSGEKETPAPARGKNRRKVGLQFHASPAPEHDPQGRAEPAAAFADDKPLQLRPEPDFNPVAETGLPPRNGLPIENYQPALHQAHCRRTFYYGNDSALNEQPTQSAPFNIRGDICEDADGAPRFRRVPECDFTVEPRLETAFLQAPNSAAPPADFTPLRSAACVDDAEQSCNFRAEAPKWPDLPAPPHEGSGGEAPRLGNHFWRQETAGLWNALPF